MENRCQIKNLFTANYIKKTLLMNLLFEEFKSLGDYYDLYVQSDTLMLADVFENFRNKCTETYELDPAHFLSAPGLAW